MSDIPNYCKFFKRQLFRDWKVLVDGQPETLLRCNYLMRAVYLRPGAHSAEFRLEHEAEVIYVSLAAIVLGLVLGELVLVWKDASRAG